MPNEEYNTVEDLVFSHSFRNWVQKGDSRESDFWTNWAARNPDRTILVNQARAVIYALQLNLRPLSDDAIDAEVGKVLQKLKDGRISPVREIPLRERHLLPRGDFRKIARAWTIAGILVAVFILGLFLGFYLNRHH